MEKTQEWWQKKPRTVVLITPKESWFSSYALKLKKLIEAIGDKCLMHTHHDELESADVVFYLSYIHITPPSVLSKSKKNLVVHGSPLPQGKGFSPMSWMVLEGATQLPLCLIEAVEKVDAGDIIYKETFALDGTELIEDLRVKQGGKIVEMCIRYLQEDSLPVGVPQEGEESFYSRRTQEDSRLDVTKTIEEQFNLLRIVDNERYPAFFEYKGVRYKVTIEKDK